jgi:hypothetical protein
MYINITFSLKIRAICIVQVPYYLTSDSKQPLSARKHARNAASDQPLSARSGKSGRGPLASSFRKGDSRSLSGITPTSSPLHGHPKLPIAEAVQDPSKDSGATLNAELASRDVSSGGSGNGSAGKGFEGDVTVNLRVAIRRPATVLPPADTVHASSPSNVQRKSLRRVLGDGVDGSPLATPSMHDDGLGPGESPLGRSTTAGKERDPADQRNASGEVNAGGDGDALGGLKEGSELSSFMGSTGSRSDRRAYQPSPLGPPWK